MKNFKIKVYSNFAFNLSVDEPFDEQSMIIALVYAITIAEGDVSFPIAFEFKEVIKWLSIITVMWLFK